MAGLKITEKIQALGPDEPFFSLEFFPPKTESGYRNLLARIERMAALKPLFVTVTWGAGGSTAPKSLALAAACHEEFNLTTCLHLTCTNMEKSLLDSTLDQAKALGIRNILALRGDPPRGEEYWTPCENGFTHAVDLVKYIRARHGEFFCIGVAAYPEGHVEGADTAEQNPETDLPYLVEKIKAGANFILTQLFYDDEQFISFYNRLQKHPSGVFRSIPVFPGLMPINTFQLFHRAAKLSHAKIPPSVAELFPADVQADDEAVKDIGVDLLAHMIDRMYTETGHGVRGFHFYTLNLEKCVARIVAKSQTLSATLGVEELPDDVAAPPGSPENTVREAVATTGRVAPLGKQTGASKGTSQVILAISTGKGTLGRDATWDDFPNGRFGDSRSPAYGEIDGYGPTIHTEVNVAYRIWGYPTSAKDITEIFTKYLLGKIKSLPWSDLGLNTETAVIQEELYELIQRNVWTIASQPAVDGAPSKDKIFGWGPKNGYVYQKAFVEFFVTKEQWKKVTEALEADPRKGDFSYYVGNAAGEFWSNQPKHSANAVTWGVFPDREIVQSTIIEEESFKAWLEEAFSIWQEWQRLYPKKSATYKLLGNVHDEYLFVSLIHHDYKQEYRLWEFLLEADM